MEPMSQKRNYKKKIGKYFKLKDNENTIYQDLWDVPSCSLEMFSFK